MENWKDLKNNYFVSDLGRIKRNDKILNKCIDRYGYEYVNISICGNVKNYRVHRLVAQAFIPNPNNLKEINHIDGNKENNCVSNLEWCSHKDNMSHARKNSLISTKGINKTIYCMVEKTKKSIYQINGEDIINEFDSIASASRKTKIPSSHICNVLKNKRKSAGGYNWKYK